MFTFGKKIEALNCSPGHVECVWTTMPKFFAHTPENNYKIFKNIVFPKIFRWTRRMQFRQPCRNFFAQVPKISRSLSENLNFLFQLGPKLFL